MKLCDLRIFFHEVLSSLEDLAQNPGLHGWGRGAAGDQRSEARLEGPGSRDSEAGKVGAAEEVEEEAS